MNWYEVQGLNIIKKDMTNDDYDWFDYGHGGTDPGCTFINGTKEKDYNLKFGRAVYAICSQYMKIGQTRTKDITVVPSARTTLLSNNAKKVDSLQVYSFHCNAYDKKSNGSEILLSITQKENDIDYKWSSQFLNYYCKTFNLTNRGIVQRKGTRGDYYYMMRDTPSNCKVKIIELFFGDNESDLKKCWNDKYFNQAVFFVASYILKRHGITIKKPEKDSYLYKVQAGAFRDKENADNLINALNKHGFDAIIKKEKE